MTDVKPQRLLVLVNPRAGSVGSGEADLRGRLSDAFASEGLSAEIMFPDRGDLRDAARRGRARAEKSEIDALVVGGGDGSIHTVAGVLAGTAIPLGILPLGTLNHFVRDMGLPADIEAAAAVIARGATQAVDVAEVNGEVFVNNSSIGLYPYVVVDRERRRELEGRSKWGALFLACVRVLWHFPLRRLTIRAEDAAEPVRSPCVFIGNNSYGLTGTALGRRERLDAGELCLYVARQKSRLGLVWIALRAALGFLDRSRDLRAFCVRSAEISSRRKRLLVAIDGEVDLLRSPLRYHVRPGALRVFVP